MHVGSSHLDPEAVFIRIYEPPGILLTPGLQKEIEKNFTRQELRRGRRRRRRLGLVPGPVRESYAGLLDSLDMAEIRERDFRIVVDYGYSAASFVLLLVVGPLGVEAISAHGFFAEELGERELARAGDRAHEAARDGDRRRPRRGLRPVRERLYLVDEQGHEVPVDQTPSTYASSPTAASKAGRPFPITVTSKVRRSPGAGSRSFAPRTRSPT